MRARVRVGGWGEGDGISVRASCRASGVTQWPSCSMRPSSRRASSAPRSGMGTREPERARCTATCCSAVLLPQPYGACTRKWPRRLVSCEACSSRAATSTAPSRSTPSASPPCVLSQEVAGGGGALRAASASRRRCGSCVELRRSEWRRWRISSRVPSGTMVSSSVITGSLRALSRSSVPCCARMRRLCRRRSAA